MAPANVRKFIGLAVTTTWALSLSMTAAARRSAITIIATARSRNAVAPVHFTEMPKYLYLMKPPVRLIP